MLRFMPGMDRIELMSGNTKEFKLEGIFNRDVKLERKSTGTFVDNLKQVSQRALQRYPKPAGIDPAWGFDITFRFVIE
ncbi:hypothetical protein [Massilia horti]|uniref:Uncharacterized protein n=1 Tax=Massilia horti TaxID=2562153 RepID=A0A4Y9SRZ7_9BURK|nr:hypothetical protein [Massilia horti]TFW28267.1 hypothetical protein E4O92_21700 [Massilia horti]